MTREPCWLRTVSSPEIAGVARMRAFTWVGPILAGNRDTMPPLTGWALRATRAHLNMLESIVVFAIAQIPGIKQSLNRVWEEKGDELLDGLVGVHDEGLLGQHDLLVELAQPSFDHLGDDLRRLARGLGLFGQQASFDQALQHAIGDRFLVGALGNVGVRKLGIQLGRGDFLVVDDSNRLSLRFLLASRKRRKKSKGDKGTFLHEEEPQILLF